MDALTLVVELVKALAWPATVLALVLILRRPIGGLIPSLQRLKYKDLELEFREQVKEIKAAADVALLPPPGPPTVLPTPDKYLKLAEASPRAVVLEAWRELEAAAAGAAHRANIRLSPHALKSSVHLVQELLIAELIEQSTAHLMHDLRRLRNDAAHAPDFALERDSALNYAEVASRIAQKLRQVRPLE